MNALSLEKVVTEALAEVGVNPLFRRKLVGKPRTTTWLGIEHGFGIRHYATGRNVYIVQTRMAGRVATITIGPTSRRVGEIVDLEWQDVRGNRLKLQDSKTGPRVVWLGDEERELIDELPRQAKIPWLFWNTGLRIHIRDVAYYWREFQAGASLRKVRLHNLRHTFASHAAMSKEPLPMIGRLLGHTNPQSTSRYAHLDDEHVLDAAEQIGAAIDRLLN